MEFRKRKTRNSSRESHQRGAETNHQIDTGEIMENLPLSAFTLAYFIQNPWDFYYLFAHGRKNDVQTIHV